MASATTEQPPQEAAPTTYRRVTWRSVLIGLLLLPFCCYWAAEKNGRIDVIFSLMVPPIACMMLLALLNIPLRRKTCFALREGEMVTIYAMLAVGTAMAAEWTLVSNMYIHAYAALADQRTIYRETMLPNLPSALYFTEEEGQLLQDYISGGKDFWYFLARLHLWFRPLSGWVVLFMLIGFTMLCINSLMREQWATNEKLAFPIVQLPVLLTQDSNQAPVWKSPFLWGAFGVMFAIDTLNAISFLYPSVPNINVRYLFNLNDMFPDRPYNAIGWTPVGIFPYMCAIGLFMPTDLLFSVIFFFFVRKAIQIAGAYFGVDQGLWGGGGLVPAPPYFSEQTWGAFIGLFVSAMFFARGYLNGVWKQIKSGTPQATGGISHRWAFIGLVSGLLATTAYCMYLGLSFGLMIIYISLFLIFSVALTRMRAQLGPPTHELAFVGPTTIFVNVAGTRMATESTIVKIANIFLFMNRFHRAHPMPHQLEAMKMAQGARLNQKSLFWVLALATVAGVVLGNLAFIFIGYKQGATGVWGDSQLIVQQLGQNHRDPSITGVLMICVGFAVVMLLDFIRFQAPGFPIHPVGYALSMNFGVDYYWFGLLIVLIIKGFVQRYYGLKGYEKLRAAALGILLAEYGAEAILGAISVITHTAMYTVSINGRIHWQQ